MNINRKTQIARVIAVQGLTPSEASEQINGRIYEAREYLKCRGQRSAGHAVQALRGSQALHR